MTRKGIVLAAALGLALANPAGAQPGPDTKPPTLVELVSRLNQDPQQRERQLYEDIEIMRRLLNRSLLSAYGVSSATGGRISLLDPGTSLGSSPDGVPLRRPYAQWQGHLSAIRGHALAGGSFHHHAGEAEGSYLKGRGVVYTVTSPVPAHDPRPESAQPAAKPLSEWERLRRELRGERVQAEGGQQERKDARIADVVLKVLADNGRHFAHLADDEQLAVAITFRGQNCALCHGGAGAGGGGERGMPGLPHSGGADPSPGGRGPDESGPGRAAPGGGPPGIGPGSPDLGGAAGPGVPGAPEVGVLFPGGPAEGGGGPGGRAGSTLTSNERVQAVLDQMANHVLLGDLHAKQGRHRDAVRVYEEAATQQDKAVEGVRLYGDVTKTQQLRVYLSGTELFGKLAQSYLAIGDEQKAAQATQRFLDTARAAEHLTQRGGASKATPKKPGTSALPLAPKLIISAPKKLLDQVGAGKMSFEAFKKAATVEYLPFAAGEGADAPGAGGGRTPDTGESPANKN